MKTILVTGCSAGGIGAAVALELAKLNHHVYATARNTSKISAELSSLSNVTVLQLDVTSDDSVRHAAEAVAGNAASGRRLDVLVNNAGHGYTMPLLDVDIAKAKKLHDVNFWGALRTIQAFADLLIASKGRVVNMSSVGSITNTPWIGTYASSKAALNSLSDTLRHELSPFNVSVVTIMAGTVDTAFHDNEPDVVLPPSSRYTAICDTINRWAKGEAYDKGGPVDKFAQSIVDDVLGVNKEIHVYKGTMSGTVRFVMGWVPTWIVDRLMRKGQGLEELSQSLAK